MKKGINMSLSDDILEKCTLEDLERSGLKMYQLKEGFRFGTDTTLLSWFASSFVRNTGKRVSVLELGSNCGACSLLILGRRTNTEVDSVELMELPYEVLKENIRLNSLEGRLNAFRSDIRELPSEVKEKQYDLVVFNPPFYRKEKGSVVPSDKSVERLNGRFEENGSLDDFVKIAAQRVIPSSGYVIMVMKGNRLTDCLDAFSRAGIAPLRLMTVHSFADRQASMILLAGKRGSKDTELRILPPLIINRNEDGNMVLTETARHIYYDEHDDCFI